MRIVFTPQSTTPPAVILSTGESNSEKEKVHRGQVSRSLAYLWFIRSS